MVSADSASDSNTRSQETKLRDTGTQEQQDGTTSIDISVLIKLASKISPEAWTTKLHQCSSSKYTFSFYWDAIQTSHDFDTWVPLYQLCQLPNKVPTRFLRSIISIKQAPPAIVSPPDVYTLYTVLKSYLHCKGALLSVVGALGPVHLHAVHPHHRSTPFYVSLLLPLVRDTTTMLFYQRLLTWLVFYAVRRLTIFIIEKIWLIAWPRRYFDGLLTWQNLGLWRGDWFGVSINILIVISPNL